MAAELTFALWLRKRRIDRKLTQGELADLASISRRWLVEIEAGRSEAKFTDVLKLVDALEADINDVPSVSRRRSGRSIVAGKLDGEAEETKRRELLTGWLATMAGVALVDVERLAALAGRPGSVDSVYIEDVEVMSRSFASQWYSVAPSVLLPPAAAHMNSLTALVTDGTSERRSMASVASAMAAMVAHLQLKLARRSAAYSTYALAEALATEAGDELLRAHVLTLRSSMYSPVSQGWRVGEPGRALAELDEAVRASAGSRARLTALIFARRAEERAASGDGTGAMRDLEEAEAGLVGSPEWFSVGPRDEAELAAFRGLVELLAGQPQRAIRTLEATLDHMDPALMAWRAAVLADQGAALALFGEIDSACETLIQSVALSRRAEGHHVERVVGVRQRLLSAHADAAAVRSLDEVLAG